jgi:nuclease-like protein
VKLTVNVIMPHIDSVQQIRDNAYVIISLLPCVRWDGDSLAEDTLRYHDPQRTPATGKDRYGRTIADAILSDGTNVNHALVKDGWCWWYRKYAPGDVVLEGLEEEARNARKGLWADLHPVPPWEWRKGK